MTYHINVEERVIKDFTGLIFAATANTSPSLNSSVSDFQREKGGKREKKKRREREEEKKKKRTSPQVS